MDWVREGFKYIKNANEEVKRVLPPKYINMLEAISCKNDKCKMNDKVNARYHTKRDIRKVNVFNRLLVIISETKW